MKVYKCAIVCRFLFYTDHLIACLVIVINYHLLDQVAGLSGYQLFLSVVNDIDNQTKKQKVECKIQTICLSKFVSCESLLGQP